MLKKWIWSFDTLVKFNSLQFIYRGYNNVLPLNIHYRLTTNTYNLDNVFVFLLEHHVTCFE